MKYEFTSGDIFKTDAKSIVNPVNCVGVMGKGLAKQFKQQFPEYYKEYKRHCRQELLQLHRPIPYQLTQKEQRKVKDALVIISFPTKHHFKEKTKLDNVIKGLDALFSLYLYFQKETDFMFIDSIAIPKLGCGNGGLKWRELKPHFEAVLNFSKFKDLKTECIIYENTKH
jgi:O-acetyl-ADP-ribose deacetylase (regulator of RNase III)